MGEVYRARDTRLGRDVAIKVLPEALANDVDRLRRFEQEARTIAALNHPNILGIHDIGAHDGAPFGTYFRGPQPRADRDDLRPWQQWCALLPRGGQRARGSRSVCQPGSGRVAAGLQLLLEGSATSGQHLFIPDENVVPVVCASERSKV